MERSQIIVMTPAELKEYAFSILDEYESRRQEQEPVVQEYTGEVVYGMRGIMGLFNVSRKTAWIYKNTFLKGAISQRGRKIVTDVAMARRLFDEHSNQ